MTQQQEQKHRGQAAEKHIITGWLDDAANGAAKLINEACFSPARGIHVLQTMGYGRQGCGWMAEIVALRIARQGYRWHGAEVWMSALRSAGLPEPDSEPPVAQPQGGGS